MERDATRFGVRIRRPQGADETVEDLAAMVAPLIAQNPSELADKLDGGLVAVKRLAFDEAAEFAEVFESLGVDAVLVEFNGADWVAHQAHRPQRPNPPPGITSTVGFSAHMADTQPFTTKNLREMVEQQVVEGEITPMALSELDELLPKNPTPGEITDYLSQTLNFDGAALRRNLERAQEEGAPPPPPKGASQEEIKGYLSQTLNFDGAAVRERIEQESRGAASRPSQKRPQQRGTAPLSQIEQTSALQSPLIESGSSQRTGRTISRGGNSGVYMIKKEKRPQGGYYSTSRKKGKRPKRRVETPFDGAHGEQPEERLNPEALEVEVDLSADVHAAELDALKDDSFGQEGDFIRGSVGQGISAQTTPSQRNEPAGPRRYSALRPAALSLLFPGMGQAYNGLQGRGIAFALTAPLLLPWLWGAFDAAIYARGIATGAFPAPTPERRQLLVWRQMTVNFIMLLLMLGAAAGGYIFLNRAELLESIVKPQAERSVEPAAKRGAASAPAAVDAAPKAAVAEDAATMDASAPDAGEADAGAQGDSGQETPEAEEKDPEPKKKGSKSKKKPSKKK